MNKKHRVGSLTAGLVLVVFGVMFLVRPFVQTLNYQVILSCWPIILILLGLELLFCHFTSGEEKLKYDGAAVFLVLVMAGFALTMGTIEFVMENFPELFQSVGIYY